jgi:dihydroorotase
MAESYDPIYKVNPPLRTSDDVLALREGLVEGVIDVIATDHAPHPKESKDTEWASAAFGMIGLEHAYSIAQMVLVDSGASNMQRLAEVMSTSASKISGLSGQGNYLQVGSLANLTLVDTSKSWTAEAQTNSKSSNNPYVGMDFKGSVVHTIYDGEFTLRNRMLRKAEIDV